MSRNPSRFVAHGSDLGAAIRNETSIINHHHAKPDLMLLLPDVAACPCHKGAALPRWCMRILSHALSQALCRHYALQSRAEERYHEFVISLALVGSTPRQQGARFVMVF